MRPLPHPHHPVRLSRICRISLCACAAIAVFLLQACLVAPEDTNAIAKTDTLVVRDTLRDTVLRIDSTRMLDGMWEFMGGTSTWEEGGESGVDTFSINPSDPFERQFYLIAGGLFVWLHYDENSSENYTAASAHSFRRLGPGRWLIDTEDTVSTFLRGDTLVFKLVSVEEYYDEYYQETFQNITRDSVNFRLYRGDFPLAAWLSGLSPDDYPSDVKPIVADGSAVASYLVAGVADWYRFTAVAGQTYRIETSGSNVDTYLSLYDVSTGQILDEDDDSGQEVNAMILWTCPASGDYHVKVRGFDQNEEGQYSLVVGPYTAVEVPLDSSYVLPRAAAPVSKPKYKRTPPLLELLRAKPLVL